ncbi:MAG: UDP-4-amino-4,6-dideoxy-N-acetyl-beta-L-altrosamine transaminase [Sulfurospirillaceae bacterium]|nr:UDP-4-amino-4,6-dideoxy-N-acetyl-beta-L-altrosamine transaminase [Sulfurospirillaceae bacterium]MDD2826862.1 UDP-4-amino-4,6-dideoxy-N-acetyl-beta-L-altrosamine transaminase [Sulfurospirillaceae bacterium]
MIPYSRQSIDQSDIDAVVETLKGDFLTGGQKVSDFEKALARYLGVKHVCVMNSATSALHVAYQIIGLQKDDEVITTPLTFAATSNTAIQCGAKPIFCDIRFDGNIDERKIEALITPRTKVISPVDFGGNPLNITAIQALCNKHKLFLIEDASHALGSQNDGIKVGNIADMTIFSFHAIKPITTFEGGAIATNNDTFYEQAKLLRSHGIVKKELWNSDMVMLGENYRLSDVACALGLSQLKRLDSFIDKRNKIAHYYDERFVNNPFFTTIPIPKNKKSTYHLYPILLDRSLWCSKEEIFKALHAKGLGVQVHYKPVYQFSYYKKLLGDIRLPNTEDFYKAELSIPCHQGMNMDDAIFVADTLLGTLSSLKGCKL